MDKAAITENRITTDGHDSFYLAAGPEDGPLVILVHGWPELSLSWRHQLPCLGALGFRAIAPDMRGYGRSSVYDRHEDYTQELIVADMIGLLRALGRAGGLEHRQPSSRTLRGCRWAVRALSLGRVGT